MKIEKIFSAALAALLCAAGADALGQAEDLEIRKYDEIVQKDNPRKVWRGEFRRDDTGAFEVLPNGRWMFTVLEGDGKGITLKILPRDLLSYKERQTEEQVWRKMTARLGKSRLDLNEYYNWSQKCIEKNYLRLAEEILGRALDMDNQSVETYKRLGLLLGMQFDFDKELALYENALLLKMPKSEEVLSLKAELLVKLGLRPEAERIWVEALSRESRHVPSLVGLGKLYISQRRFREAESRLRRAEEVAGVDKIRGNVLKWLGAARLKNGDFPGAIKALEEAALLAHGDRDVLNMLGTTFFYSGEVARAKEKYLEVLGITPEDLAAQMNPPPGSDESPGEDSDKPASDPFGPSDEFDPVKSRAMANLALCLIRENAHFAAERYLGLAAGLDPTSAFTWVALGALRDQQERYYEAREAYRKALAIEPFNSFAHYSLGILALRAGEVQAARESLLAATDSDPDFSDALVKLGYIAVMEARSEDAILFLGSAVSLCPGVADWHAALGIAHCLAKDYASAAKAFEKARNLDAASARARAGAHLALYYSGQGRDLEDEAYLQMKRALDESSATMPEDVKSYLIRLVALIEENRGKVQWIDDFERPDSDQIARKWEPALGTGPLMRIHRGRASIEGNQVKTGETVLERAVPSEKFVRFEADLFAKFLSPVESGIQVVYRVSSSRGSGDIRAGVRLGKNPKGKVTAWEYDTSVSKWKEISTGNDWPETESGANRLSVELVRGAGTSATQVSYTVRFTVNGSVFGQDLDSDRFRRGFKTGEIWVGAFAGAERGNEVKVSVDNVRLVIWK